MAALNNLTAKLQNQGQTVTCAESCTGGLLAAELTRLSGSSAWFKAGFITYSNESKHKILNVKEKTICSYGAVSSETVSEMAQGALQLAGADYALSISGVAGPTGGTPGKPVGTVWFGLATKDSAQTQCRIFTGSRDDVRAQAVEFAVKWLADVI